MEDTNLLSFSLQNKIVGIVNIRSQNKSLRTNRRLFFCNGKYWRKAGVFILLIINSTPSFSQTLGVLPLPGNPSCVISPTSQVCPKTVTTYSAPSGMTGYQWSITGAGTITGSVNSRTVNVAAGPNCNNTYILMISFMNSLVLTTCSLTISIVDNTPPTIVGAPNKTVPYNTPNIIFDNPTMSDACGTPTLLVLSTTSSTLPSGSVSYTRTWKAIDGCGNSSSPCSQTVTVNNVTTCTITGSNTICPGGSANLCAPAGATSYLWNTGATTQCITVTSAGTYSVTVVDAGGSSTCNKTLTLNTQSSCIISGNASICSGRGTDLCALAGAVSYSWSTGVTTQCITVTSAGTYSVTVVESNGCSSSCSKVVTTGTPSSCTISGSSSICSGGSTNLCAPAGATTYSWNTGATTQCITVTSAGTYSVTVTNSSGCSSTCSKIITVNNPPNCSITGNLLICSGRSTQLCAPVGLASYLWSTGETTQCITVNAIGNYSVIVTGSNGCTSSCSQTVDGQAPPTCNINGNTNICPGGSTNLCALAGAVSYSWSTGSTTQCILVTSGGTYSVIVTNANGCSNTCRKTVTVNDPPICSISGNSTFCPGGFTNLCATTGASSYLWNTGATTQCITVNSAGTYSVTITGAGGCSSTCNKTITITNTQPCSISGNNSFCPGGSTNLCAPVGAASYSWSTGASTQCINVSSAGNYSVSVTDANGCSSVCSKIVTVNNPQPCSISGNSSFCPGGSTNLCAPAGATSYSWNTGATSQCITINGAGNYSVTITDANGCSSSCNKDVTINNPQPCSITGNNTACTGESINLCATAGAVSYSWSTGATTQCILVSSTGTYSITVVDANGCSSTCSKSVTVNVAPQCFVTGNGSFCTGGSTNICAPAVAASYSWSTGATTQCISVNSAGNYSVTITNDNGCSSTCNKNVTVNNPPNCSIAGNLLICSGGSSNLCATAGGGSYLWSTGSTNQCITVTTSGNYSVTLTGANGCSSNCSQNIDFLSPPACTITGNTSICSGGSASLCASPGASSYSWNTGATTQCINVTGAGIYTVTVTGVNGCSSTCNKSVTVNAALPCSITGNGSFCTGGSTNLCAPAGAASYSWSTGATTQCISVNSAGNYSVTITNDNGCSSTCNKNVTVNNPPNCSIAGNLLICSGGSSNLCATAGGGSYLWSTGSTNQCITVTTSGNYSVTLTGTNGCSSTCSQNIDFLSLPICNITGNTSICSGSSTSLCASPGAASYSWNTGATTQCINVSTAGIYTVTITGVNECTSSCSKTVTVNNPLSCSISGNNSICSGGSTTLCVAAGAASYAWSTEGTMSCITVNYAGTYSVLITDANGCISTCSQTVTVNQIPTCTITGNNDICQGSNSVFTASGGTSYVWNTGATTASINVLTAGFYSVNITDASGCSSSCSRTLATHNCGISLKKIPDVCEFPDGVSTTVNFKYVVKNTSNFFNASGNLIDDNGTPGNTADDVNVCTWGPIAPGDSTVCTHAFTITSTYTNIAKASGTSGGLTVSATATATVAGINCNCNLSYPDNTNLPRSAAVFNESECLQASDPGPASCGSTGSVIKLWYTDEHALLLGVRAVSVKTFSGTTITNYNMTPTPATPACFSNPFVGDTISTGDQAANDFAAGGGRPLWPVIFITDLTVNGASSRRGDWQQGGKGIPPTGVCGMWKGAVKTIDKTRNPPLVTITTDVDPVKNNWSLGSGSHTPAGGFASLINGGYGAEVSWDVNSLGLIAGHTYRLVFMVHDGDQNKTGGDVGETCTTIHIPDVNCTPVTPLAAQPPSTDKVCYTGTSHSYVKASQEWTINTTTNQATIRTTFSKNFVDNTYGLSAIAWPSGHSFIQLVESNHVQMALYDANNIKKMEFKVDYISESSTVASGYKCLGVTGGKGGMVLGNASDVVSATTSIDKNLNTFGYILTTNSPATNSNYTPNATYPNWIYEVWYEVTVNLSAFGPAGFGRPVITFVHASPSKTGSNSEIVVDTTCTQAFPRLSAPDSPTHINAIAYPNPFGDDITINFITPLDEDANIIITDVAGRDVESLKHAAGTINMGHNLRAGIYFVRISQGDYYRIIKIIKSAGID